MVYSYFHYQLSELLRLVYLFFSSSVHEKRATNSTKQKSGIIRAHEMRCNMAAWLMQ